MIAWSVQTAPLSPGGTAVALPFDGAPDLRGSSPVQEQDMTMTETAKVLNGLLRGEVSAVETYRQALDKVGESAAESDLRNGDNKYRIEQGF